MPTEMDNVQNRKLRELIEYDAAVKAVAIPDKLSGESPMTKAVNAIIENLIRKAEMVLPMDIVEPLGDMEGAPADAGLDQEEIAREVTFQIPPPEPEEYILAEPMPDGTTNARLGHDGSAWQAIRFGVAKIVSNDGSGDYTIAEQIWDPDLGTPAWINLGVTVTGDGGGPAGSPNGDYVRGGTNDGKVYYELTGTVFETWWFNSGGRWILNPTVGTPGNDYWAIEGAEIEGSYLAYGGNYTGDPVVAATTLSARDISQNTDGVVGDYVLFWQQVDDNGDTETLIALATAEAAAGPFVKDIWFDVTGDFAFRDADATHDYLNRVIQTEAFWDTGVPVDGGGFGEDDVYIYDVNGVARAQANGQCQQRFVTENTLVDHPIMFLDKTESLGDFYLQVEGATGNLQAKSENFVSTRYSVRVRISAGKKVMAAAAVDIS